MSERRTWWKEGIVYQIYPRSFMDSNGDGFGDINGIRARLEYIKELGADIIWISPLLESPGDDNGYDISDYRKILDDFGTMEEYEAMLHEAHTLGLKIVMDLVVNHTSDEHPWFIESKKSKDNPYRDYYIWKPARNAKEPNNWGACFGGSAWEYDAQTDMFYLHLFSKKQPDLNWENPKVRDEVFDMMNWWCEKGIDGFRMDVISMISKDQSYPDGEMNGGLYGDGGAHYMNGPRVHEFLQEMNQKVLSKYDIMTVGETAGVTIEEAKKYAGNDGKELNMVFQFEHVSIGDGKLGKWTTKKYDFHELKTILTKWQTQLEGKAWNSIFWGNHDQPRAVSRFGDDREEYREVSAKMLATCEMTLKGTPYVYQGEELGMTNAGFTDISQYRDIESIHHFEELTSAGLITKEDMLACLQKRSRDNSRTPMQWDDTANAGFTTGEPWIAVNKNYPHINAKIELGDANSVFRYYQKMIKLRKKHLGLIYGTFTAFAPESDHIFAYERVYKEEKYLIVNNFTSETVPLTMPKEYTDSDMLIGNYERTEFGDSITLQPYEAFVLKKK